MTYLYIILLLFCQQEKYSVEKRCFNYDMPTFLLKKSQIMTTKNSLTFKIRLFFILLRLEAVSYFTHAPDLKLPIRAGFV